MVDFVLESPKAKDNHHHDWSDERKLMMALERSEVVAVGKTAAE